MTVRRLDVFLSSTASDLEAFRGRVRQAVAEMGHHVVGMETFPALGGLPAQECKRLAAGAGAVVVIVAYRYGFVPPKERGGDGERSITWLEVEAALAAGRP